MKRCTATETVGTESRDRKPSLLPPTSIATLAAGQTSCLPSSQTWSL
jgi:hypothetical protein